MKKWVRARRDGIGHYVLCPFCPDRGVQALNECMPWCSTCGCEYRITACGATFDQSLKTPRYAWGKALNLAGGARIGKFSLMQALPDCEACRALLVLNTTGEPRAAVSMTVAELVEVAGAVSTPELAQRVLVGLRLLDEEAACLAAADRARVDAIVSGEVAAAEPIEIACPACHKPSRACVLPCPRADSAYTADDRFVRWLRHVYQMLNEESDRLDPERKHPGDAVACLDNAAKSLATAIFYLSNKHVSEV